MLLPQHWGPARPWASPSALGLSQKCCGPQEVQERKGPHTSSGYLLGSKLRLLQVCPDARVKGRSLCMAGLRLDVRLVQI